MFEKTVKLLQAQIKLLKEIVGDKTGVITQWTKDKCTEDIEDYECALSSGLCSHGDAIVEMSKAYADFQTACGEAQPQEKQNGQLTADNSAMLKCTCYSSSFCSEGNYYLVRNDCPVHKGTLQQ